MLLIDKKEAESINMKDNFINLSPTLQIAYSKYTHN